MSPARSALSQRLGLALCAFSALLFAPSFEDAYVLPQRLALTLGAALLALGAPKRLRLSALAWLALIWLAWRLCCRAFGDPPGSTLAWLAEQAPFWALLLFGGSALQSAAQRRHAAILLLSAGALGSAIAFLPKLGWDPWSAGAVDLGFQGRLHGTLGNPDFLGGWLALLLPLGIAAVLKAPGRLKAFASAGTLLIAMALWRSGARAAWLAGGAGSLAAFAILRPQALTRARALGLAAVTAALIVFALLAPSAMPGRLREAADLRSDAWRSRAFMGRCALDIALAHPLVGVGPGGFADAYLFRQGERLSAGEAEPYRYTFDAHNDWLQIAAESGWLGLLLWALVWAWALRTAWRRGGGTGAALAGGLIAFGLQACFHFPWAVWPTAALILLAVAASAELQSAGAQTVPALGWLWALVLALAFALGLRQSASSALLNAGHVAQLVPAAQSWATPFFQKAASLRRDDARAWEGVAREAQRKGQWEPAVDAYQEALRSQPSQAELWVNLGLALGQQGSLETADAVAEQGLRLNPRSSQAWFNASKIAWLRGDSARAERLLREGLAAAGPSAQASFNLGAILYNGRRFKEAAAAFQAVLALEPGHAEAQRLLKESSRAK